MRHRLLLALVPAVCLLYPTVRTQTLDPHVRGVDPLPLDYTLVDDELLVPEQMESERHVRQSHPIDYRARLGAWDSGVIPYELSAEFTSAERQRILGSFDVWMSTAPVRFVPRTTQVGYLMVTRDPEPNSASPCFSGVGQPRRAAVVRTNLGGTCASSVRTITHEFGHALGLRHEHQRADRDSYLRIDFTNVASNAVSNFNLVTGVPLVGDYDFGSIMHYSETAFAVDRARPTIIPHPQYSTWAGRMGTGSAPTDIDHAVTAFVYNQQLRESTIRTPTESVRNRFDRADLLLAMERLHAFYMSRYGLNRPDGLSIGGAPDFLGIAQWIFDVYLPARSAGFSQEGAFDIVIAAITRSDEWRQKNPGRAPLTPSSFTPYIGFNRDEFLAVLTRLDNFYRAPEGLQRPDGLSIAGGPDFLGIAAWIFDVYLNQRLTGASATAAWTITENAIRATDEWRRKH